MRGENQIRKVIFGLSDSHHRYRLPINRLKMNKGETETDQWSHKQGCHYAQREILHLTTIRTSPLGMESQGFLAGA